MAVVEITQRHVSELAMTWWRRDTSPVLLHHGLLDSFAALDARLLSYADGAVLDPVEAFKYLADRMRPTAPDFVADVVAGLFVLRSQGGISPHSQAWLEGIPDQQTVASAHHQLMRWLGCKAQTDTKDWVASLCATRVEESIDDPGHVSRALQSHRPDDLRFIDAWGQIQGHLTQEVAALNTLPDPFTSSQLCTYLLLKPQHVFDCVQQVVARGADPAVVFLATGISGETNMLPNLLRSASQPEIAVLALDAFRRITGFDALAKQELTWTHQHHKVKKPLLTAAYRAAQQWFDAHEKSLPEHNCFLGQRGDDMRHLVNVLRYGRQADREIAAMRAAGSAGTAVFPVRSKVAVQQMVLDHFSPETSEAA